MSEQQITIVRDSSSEVKIFVGGELRGRYKDDSTALAHLATALVELTAAQNRVAELEIAAKLGKRLGKIVDKLRPENEQLTADNARLRELLRECVYELMPDAYELRDKIEAAIGEGE